NVGADVVTAFPVVPCAGAPASYGRAGVGGGEPAEDEGPASAPPPPPAKAITQPPKVLYCILGNGEQIKIDKDNLIIGRSRTCDIIIQSAKISRQHASITRAGDDFFMEDLGSANGVWKDGEKITRSKIEPGDVYTISEESLTFELR